MLVHRLFATGFQVQEGQVRDILSSRADPAGRSIHAHYMSAGAYSFIFNMPSVAPGFYTIKIQWQVSYGSPQGTGYVGYRTLTAIALPT